MSQRDAQYEYTSDNQTKFAQQLYEQYINSKSTILNITFSGTTLFGDNKDFKEGFIAGVKFFSNILNDLKK